MVRRALVLAVLALAALPAMASAHAQLEGTAPQRGATLHREPDRVLFRFSETVVASLGAVRVFDGGGREVQRGAAFHPGGRGDTVAVRLRPGLPRGGYTATYRVISADSHPVSGGFSFSVGTGGAAPQSVDRLLQGTAPGPVTSTALGAARAVQYAAIALAVGTLLLGLLCWLPGLRAATGAGERWRTASAAFAQRSRRLWLGAAAAGAISATLGILLEGAVGEGSSLWSAARPDVVGAVLGTRFGVTSGLAVVVWLAVAGLALAPGRRTLPALEPASVGATGIALPRARTGLLAALLGALCLVPALGGHAASSAPVWLMLPANLVHVVAVSGWIGGLAVLVIALRGATACLEPADRTRLLVEVVGRFSTWAPVAVAAVLASGIVQSLVNLSAWGQLVHTAYGRAVLIKIGLLTVLLGLGATQRLRVLPALRRARDAPGRAGVLLRRVLRAELAVGVVVLGVTGALATYAPGDVVAAGPASASTVLGPARLESTVDPARVGVNEVHLYLFDRRTGAQWDKPKQVTATAKLPSRDISLPVQLRKAGPGHYVATATALPVRGSWRLQVAARVSDFDAYTTTITVPVR